MKKLLSCLLIFALICSLAGCGAKSNVNQVKPENGGVNLGDIISETEGNTTPVEFKFKSAKAMLKAMTLAAENDKFGLYYSEDTMAVALVDKATGKIMTTNPYNAAEDKSYSGSVASLLNSQLTLTYLENDITLVDLYSADDCINIGQYKINVHSNGLSVDMSVGVEKDGTNIPKVISPERYNDLCSKLDEFDIELLEIYYLYFPKDQFSQSGVKDIYSDFTPQDIYCCNSELSEREQKKLAALFESVGYTKETLESDLKAFGVKDAAESFPNFKLRLCYALTDKGVSVSVPASSIKYNADFPLLKISLLPYFGAESPNKKADGYLFIPDGSGAIINLKDDHLSHRAIITGKVYGENGSELPKKGVVETTKQYYLPVFGTVRNNASALFGIISSGDGNSQITARLGSSNGNYYATSPEFILADYEQYTKVSVVSNNWSDKTLFLYDSNMMKEDLTVDYYFLTGDNANYSSMASEYNKYLFSGTEKQKVKDTVIHLDTIGSVITEKSFLGFDYNAETVLTSFDENKIILEDLSKETGGNYSLNLRGWQKNGLDTAISSKLKISSALGGKNSLKSIKEYCEKNNIQFSLENNISFVENDGKFDDFSKDSDACRTLELMYAESSKISPDTMLSNGESYVVTAGKYVEYIGGLVKSGEKYSLANNLGFGKIGSNLNADYSSDNLTNRSQAKAIVEKALKDSKKTTFSFEGSNAYVLPFASAVNNITLYNSGFAGESASVPFLQMSLGGMVSCRSEAINLQGDTREQLLSCIEFGVVPTYLISYGNTSKLKVTDYTEYYAVDYKILRSSLVDTYKYIEPVINAKDGSNIISHKVLITGVTFTEYENGKGVYVNHTNKDYKLGKTVVPAMDYLIKE